MTGTKYALGVEYDGSQFHGWQRQHGYASVQETLEHALLQVSREAITVICAGRTDAGVHAIQQVVHFTTTVSRSVSAWSRGVNRYLPPSVRILWAQPVAEDFHARFSAHRRHYCYWVLPRSIPGALLRQYALHYPHPLHVARMHQAAQVLLGEHDFLAFSAGGCQSASTRRRIESVSCVRRNAGIYFDVQADAFLYRMVRNIVGCLLEIGKGRLDRDWLQEVLARKDRRRTTFTAPACGLYLVNILYDDRYRIPHADHQLK